MRRLLFGTGLVVLALTSFYVAWPAWSARQIKAAVDAKDTAALERKIDFPRVRERAKEVAAAEIKRSLERLQKEGGSLGAAIAGQLQGELGTKIAGAAVESILTPQGVIDLVHDGRDLRRIFRRIGKPETQAAEKPQSAPTASGDGPPPARLLSLASIKSYRLTGPTSIAVGLARDKAAKEAEMIAEMAFTGGDWKVVGLVPRL